ncbi:MAG TPA: carbohydrate binding family 9 domain-containing protein, partial [Cyclobacteriaceae bacterium]|nr:carbohydrate binding family 9 domain-containing protein [Cyclobacteriaceae bacterium]
MKNLLLLIFVGLALTGKTQTPTRKAVGINKTDNPILIDGRLDEDVWHTAVPAKDFMQTFPYDSSLSTSQCEIYLTYDDTYLYVATKCNDIDPEQKFVIISQRRDFRGPGIESINLVFDTFRDQTNAFSFGINPQGIQREGLIANGGTQSDDLSLDWDNKWLSEAYIGDGYWSSEMAIPFKTIRFPEGSTQWYFNAYRVDSKTNERTAWNRVPRNFRPFSLSYTGELNWDKPLPKPGPNISIIPFGTVGLNKDFEEKSDTKFDRAIGGDIKIA